MEDNKTNQVGAYTHNLQFSVFPQGTRNHEGDAVLATRPFGSWSIRQVYDYIKSEQAKQATETLRSMLGSATKSECSDYKKLNFRFVTFRGIFSSRKATALTSLSPFIVIDIDGLTSTEEAHQLSLQLPEDKNVNTALSFISPGGLGVKWVVEIPEWLEDCDYKEQHLGLCRHLVLQYGYEPDWGCSDVCRACFLGHDDQCYINPKYFQNENE